MNWSFPLSRVRKTNKPSILACCEARPALITLDEGYVNTGSTLSAITFLDGEQGILRYRGYPIEELARNCDFVEVAYLLIYGELPTETELDDFQIRHSASHDAA